MKMVLGTRGNGWGIKSMDTVYKYGPMEQNTKVNGKTVQHMVRVYSNMLMEINMMGK